MTPALLSLLLAADPTVRPTEHVSDWWESYSGLTTAWPRTIERAIAGGFAADRVGWAFASAYQAALRAMVPALSDGIVAALCVTEAQGTSPRAMQTTLAETGTGGLRLDGAKRWTTLGPAGGRFLVAARDARAPGERPSIRLIAVPADAAGVHIQAMPPTSFVPEIPHAQLRLDNVMVRDADVLPGDGYTQYVKPFRTIEDLHVHAAVLAYLLRESRRLAWPRRWTEDALATLLAFCAVADLDPAAADTHIALAGAMGQAERCVSEGDALWAGSPDAEAAMRWQRDRKLLTLASQARAARIAKAWESRAAGNGAA